MTSPSASVIIPTCDRPEDLRACLELLVPQLPPDGSVEILVCDDGRQPGTRSLLAKKFPSVRWLAGPRRGPAANRNLGAAEARAPWLVFLDDDCLPRPGFLGAHLSVAGSPRSAFVGPTCLLAPRPSLLWEGPHNPAGRNFISCNFSISRSLFAEVGRFDERFPMALFEDTELAARMERLGVVIQSLPDAVVDHPLRPVPPPGKLARRWEARVISTYDFGASTTLLAFALPRHVALVILSRFRGMPWSAGNIRAAFRFAAEFFLVLFFLPGWIARYHSAPRSAFWREQVLRHSAPPRFGL